MSFTQNSFKHFLLLTLLLLIVSCVNKANKESNSISKVEIRQDTVYEQPEDTALFSGCEDEENPQNCSNQKLISHIYKGIKFKKQDDLQKSTLLISFIIEKDGSLSTIENVKGNRTIEKSNLTQVLNDLPKWIPAKENGKIVRSRITLPIKIHYE